jgi:hypothetical protein
MPVKAGDPGARCTRTARRAGLEVAFCFDKPIPSPYATSLDRVAELAHRALQDLRSHLRSAPQERRFSLERQGHNAAIENRGLGPSMTQSAPADRRDSLMRLTIPRASNPRTARLTLILPSVVSRPMSLVAVSDLEPTARAPATPARLAEPLRSTSATASKTCAASRTRR